jgi:tRNA nucleotidyltransferase (CCA-adding enzyme)
MIAIVSHRHADFDALGAVVAAHALIPDAVPVIDAGNPAVEAYLAMNRDSLGIRTGAQVPWEAVDRLVVVDTQDPDRLDVVPEAVKLHAAWRVIDHHPAMDLMQGDLQVETVGAATTLVVEHLRQQGVVPTALEATTMALGIYADTGGLLYPRTTERDAACFAWLIGQGANLGIVRQFSNHPLPEPVQALLEQLLESGRPVTIAGHAGLVASVACADHVDDVSGAVAAWAGIVGRAVVVAAVQMGGTVHLLGRASLSSLDLAKAWRPLGARGHAEACYARIKQRSGDDVMAEAVALLEASLPVATTIRHLMTSPVQAVPPDTTVAAALQLLADWGYSTLPITAEGQRPVGLVSRAELDKARRHGLDGAPVKAIMRSPTCVSPDLALADVPDRLAAAARHRLFVVEHDRLIGIVAGSDLVRDLYLARLGLAADRPGPDILARRIRDWGGDAVLDLLHAAGAAAARFGVPLYWVGGSVRDLLLDRPAPADVDLVVDGDGVAFAEAWAGEMGARVGLHERFGTAKVETAAGPVDIATSRRETYAHPGAQPDVHFSPISLDLSRRDFTVNALAIRLDPPYFGQLLDFFGGWQDLQAGRLAVLHPLSYLEDPSRIWRAVRFERTLGFHLSAEDEGRARTMLDGHLNHRVAQEMRLLWTRDGHPADSLARLDELGALRGFAVAASPGLKERFRRFEANREAFGVPVDEAWLGYLVLLLAEKPTADREALLTALKLSDGESDRLRTVWACLGTPVPDGDPELYAWGQDCPSLALACVACLGDAEAARVGRYWGQLRQLRPSLSGHDLVAMGFRPGPMFGRVLAAILHAKLAGDVATPEDERRLAAQLAAAEEPHADRSE